MRSKQAKAALRFVKYRKSKRTGFPVSRCQRMLRFTKKDDYGDWGYTFRCKERMDDGDPCGWFFPYDDRPVTAKAPTEVRMHVQEHHPTKRWAVKKWGFIQPRADQCPHCGFDLVSWRHRKVEKKNA